jgi:thioredoxin 1
MLYTNLKHLETAAEHASAISENENVMVVCGRMGPMCIPVYRIAEELEATYKNVKFFDLEFDNPESLVIRNLPEVHGFKEIPFIVYYKNGSVVKATSGIQAKIQVTSILDNEFAKTAQDHEISINGCSPLGFEVKPNITVRNLELNGEDLRAFRW